METAGTLSANEEQYNTYRTSHIAWLGREFEISDRVARRMGDITQLNVDTAELHQLSRYSISGEFLPHPDYRIKSSNIDREDDRIATLMFYLNDVNMGGNTIFLNWNLTVAPVKNSAILWFNYLPNGELDEDSIHSGCPVLQGTKWVLNKWFLNGGNEFKKPCGLSPDDSFLKYYLQ